MLAMQKERDFNFKRKPRDGISKLPHLSDDVKHLIRAILDPDPVSRWTWREISHHQWMLEKDAKPAKTTAADTSQNVSLV
jgi:serine/threonine protein kinase